MTVVGGLIWWFAAPALMALRATMDRALLYYARAEQLEVRVAQLTETRADAVDLSSAELRRIERDLHDGAQARLVALAADRGLAGAVESLAIDMAVPVETTIELRGRPPAPVETPVYFAIAEALANVGKHSGAKHAWITLNQSASEGRGAGGLLRAVVGDDGVGGADPGRGTGMRGVATRLGAFDGRMWVSSPAGGPTLITLEVPCVLSSPRTSPSSGPD